MGLAGSGPAVAVIELGQRLGRAVSQRRRRQRAP